MRTLVNPSAKPIARPIARPTFGFGFGFDFGQSEQGESNLCNLSRITHHRTPVNIGF